MKTSTRLRLMKGVTTMSMGFKICPHCKDGEAEALYGIDGKVHWYCPECNTEWEEEGVEKPDGDTYIDKMFQERWD